MNFRSVSFGVVLVSVLFGDTAIAQESVDAEELVVQSGDFPVSLERIKRQLERVPTDTNNKSLLRLNYYIDVYARAPRINLFVSFDVHSGPTRSGSPTHNEMLRAMTPNKWRSSAASRSGVIGW